MAISSIGTRVGKFVARNPAFAGLARSVGFAVPRLPSLILIHGLKFAGKSTIAERLVGDFGYVRVKMADPLKNMLRSLLRDAGLDDALIERCIEGDLKEVPLAELCGRTPRLAMTSLGNEWRDLLHSELWLRIAEARVAKLVSRGRRVVVDDIRYPHELGSAVFNGVSHRKWVVTRGDLHFRAVEEDRHPSERPMPISLFHSHLVNDHATPEPLLDETDRLLFGEPIADDASFVSAHSNAAADRAAA